MGKDNNGKRDDIHNVEEPKKPSFFNEQEKMLNNIKKLRSTNKSKSVDNKTSGNAAKQANQNSKINKKNKEK